METNVSAQERTPRLVIALAAGVAAAVAPTALLKGLFLGSAAGILGTVITGYCPVNAALEDREADAAHWRTLRVHRVET